MTKLQVKLTLRALEMIIRLLLGNTAQNLYDAQTICQELRKESREV